MALYYFMFTVTQTFCTHSVINNGQLLNTCCNQFSVSDTGKHGMSSADDILNVLVFLCQAALLGRKVLCL